MATMFGGEDPYSASKASPNWYVMLIKTLRKNTLELPPQELVM